MKTTLFLSLPAALLLALPIPSSAQGVFDRIKNAAKDKANQQVDDTTNSTVDSAINKGKKTANSGNNSSGSSSGSSANTSPAAPSAANDAPPSDTPSSTSIKTYQNYDFVPGDTILFADDFTATQDGEIPRTMGTAQGPGSDQ